MEHLDGHHLVALAVERAPDHGEAAAADLLQQEVAAVAEGVAGAELAALAQSAAQVEHLGVDLGGRGARAAQAIAAGDRILEPPAKAAEDVALGHRRAAAPGGPARRLARGELLDDGADLPGDAGPGLVTVRGALDGDDALLAGARQGLQRREGAGAPVTVADDHGDHPGLAGPVTGHGALELGVITARRGEVIGADEQQHELGAIEAPGDRGVPLLAGADPAGVPALDQALAQEEGEVPLELHPQRLVLGRVGDEDVDGRRHAGSSPGAAPTASGEARVYSKAGEGNAAGRQRSRARARARTRARSRTRTRARTRARSRARSRSRARARSRARSRARARSLELARPEIVGGQARRAYQGAVSGRPWPRAARGPR